MPRQVSLPESSRPPHHLFSVRRDPCGIRLHEAVKEFPRPVICELATGVEKLVDAPDIGFWLRHSRNVQKNERLPQMMVGSESADCTRRCTDHGTGLAAPYAR